MNTIPLEIVLARCDFLFIFLGSHTHGTMLKHRLSRPGILSLMMTLCSVGIPLVLNSQGTSNLFTHYSVDMGLAQSTVNCMLRDRQGFLWIGTGGGLSRFDGHRFVNYIHQPGRTNGLSDNYVRRLFQDSLGFIWIGTEEGLDRYDPSNGAICNIFRDSLNSGKTWYIPFYDNGGNLYFAEGIHGIWKIDARKGSLTNILKSDKFSGIANQCAIDDSGCWLNARISMIHFNVRKNTIEVFSLPEDSRQVFGMLCVPGKPLLLATNKGLVVVDNKKKQCIPAEFFEHNYHGPVFACCVDMKGQYWFGLDKNKMLVCDSTFKTIKTFTQGRLNDKEFYPVSISCLFGDRDGNIWAGTDGNGFYHVNSSLSRFPVFKFGNDVASHANFIRSFLQTDDGFLYTGTYDAGLYKVNLQNGQYSRISLRKGDFEPGSTITSINPLGKGLFITTNRGYSWYDPVHNLVLDAGLPGSLKNESWSNFQCACVLNESTILAGGSGFWCIARTRPDGVLSVSFDTIRRYQFSSMFLSGKDTVIAGMLNHGLVRFTISHGNLKPDRIENTGALFRDNHFRAFLKDRKNQLWAASSLGLLRLTTGLEIKQLFTKDDGLSNNDVYGILEDKQGFLWITTSHGISRMDPETGTFHSYSTEDGLQSEEFNSGACYRNKNGVVYLGGVNGFNYFSPEEIRPNPVLAKPVITRLFINGEAGDHLAETSKGEIDLKFFQNFISIEVAALEMSRPEMNQYAFLLEGLDKEWVPTGTINLIRYNNLQPGSYSFWVKAANNDDVWCTPVCLLTLHIAPPFWKTWWFRMPMLILIFVMTFLAMRWFFNRKLLKEREVIRRKQEIEQLRSNIARDLHDTAGATLTRISMMGELAKRDLQRHQDIAHRLDNITSTSRSLVDSFGEIIWATNPVHDNLESLVAYLRNFISEFTLDLPLKVNLFFPEKIPDLKMKPDARHHLFLIARESINNSVKHASAAHLEVSLVLAGNWLVISIRDDGLGMDLSEKSGSGNGLRFIQKRAHEIGAYLQIESEKGSGTSIIIRYSIE